MQEQTNTEEKVLNPMQGAALNQEDRPLEESDFAGLTNDQLIAVFIESLIEEKGLQPNDRLRADLKTRFNSFYSMKLAMSLTTEDQQKIAGLEGDSMTEQIAEIVKNAGVDTGSLIEKTMDEFQKQYLNEGGQNA